MPAKASGDRTRVQPAECASYSWPWRRVWLRWGNNRHPLRFDICLVKDTHNLRLKFRKFYGENETAGMKDQIASLGQQINVAPQCFSHATLDPIALVSFANYFAGRKTNARRGSVMRIIYLSWSQKPAHRRGLPLAPGRIGPLIVGVLLQAQTCQRLRAGLIEG
jgi:hypothetical protein